VSRQQVTDATRLATILDALPDALLLVNGLGVVVNGNTMAHEVFETPRAPLIGQSALDLLPGFDRGQIPGAARRATDPSGRRVKPARLVARRTDGSAFPAEVLSADLSQISGDGQVMLIVRDLADMVNAEDELHRQQRQTELILRAASEGIIGVDVDGKIILVNPAAARLLRYRASDMGGQDFHTLLQHSRTDGSPYPRDISPVIDALGAGRRRRVRDEVLWRHDGTPLIVEMSVAPMLEGEELVGAMMTFTDHSEIRSVSRRNEELVSILRNEMRTPLQTIYQHIGHLVQDEPEGQHQTQLLRSLLQEIEYVTRLVDEIVDYQRVEVGAAPLERRPAPMAQLLQTAVNAAAGLASNPDVAFSIHTSPCDVLVDQERIVQALSHLVADAVNASPAGATITVAGSRQGGVARIEVGGPTPRGSATHLPIARAIIERHGGYIRTEDLPTGGNSYIVELPLTTATSTPEASSGGRQPQKVGQIDRANGIKTSGEASSVTRGIETPAGNIPGQVRQPADVRQLTDIRQQSALSEAREIATESTACLSATTDERLALEPGSVSSSAVGEEFQDGDSSPSESRIRQLLVWSQPDDPTASALHKRGYQPVVVRTREEVDQYATYHPAALLVDPLSGPITRTALQSLRSAARSASVPVLVTAGLSETTPEYAYGADPAMLVRSLADPHGQAPRVLLIESNTDIATAFSASLTHSGMETLYAASESEAVSRAASLPPDVVVLDLMLIRHRRVGIVDWLRNHHRLHATPIIVYTALDFDQNELHRISRGETTLLVTERASQQGVQQRILDLISKIGST